MTKLLFICSRNQWRSPTAEDLFQSSSDYEARSAGTSDSARIRVGLRLLEWADQIIVMERKHVEILRARFPSFHPASSIAVLEIPDDYQRNDPELIELLKARLATLLQIAP
jgi:predicted protein tyrosine phosphatase